MNTAGRNNTKIISRNKSHSQNILIDFNVTYDGSVLVIYKHSAVDTYCKESFSGTYTVDLRSDIGGIKDFFLACVKFETFRVDGKGKRSVRMTNNTSMDFVIKFGGNPVQLRAFTSRNVSVAKDKNLNFTVENMWVPTDNKHPEFSIKIK